MQHILQPHLPDHNLQQESLGLQQIFPVQTLHKIASWQDLEILFFHILETTKRLLYQGKTKHNLRKFEVDHES